MLKCVFVLLLTTTVCIKGYARNDKPGTDSFSTLRGHEKLRVSLLTCGAGNETWQAFGHCAIRIVDSTRDSLHRDLTYNYGFYDPFEGSLEKQFLKGRIRVFLKITRYNQFINEYIKGGRSVEEVVLLLDSGQKKSIQAFLENNALIENKYYTYHIFYDNCTTRVRDALQKTLGPGFIYGQVLPDNAHMTFHDAYAQCLEHQYTARLFGAVFFGSKTDVPVNNYSVMFLPDFLEKGLQGATLNGEKISSGKVIIANSNLPPLPGINVPFIIMCFIALLTIAGISSRRLRILGNVMSFIVLLISSLTGLGILYAWFGSGYDFCSNNFNILWALPCNIILPFLPSRIRAKYSMLAMWLIGISLAIHITGVQVMSLFELVPFWLSLFCVYGVMYRKATQLFHY